MKKYLLILGALAGVLLFAPHAHADFSGYTYQRTITVSSTLVAPSGTSLSSFPIEVSSTLADIAHSSHGGTIQNLVNQVGGSYTSQIPADLIFSTSTTCATNAQWEFESYNSSTGAFIAWVNNGTLSSSTGLTFYMCYDNASQSTQIASTTQVWDSNYKGVWHLADGSTLSGVDSTGNNSASSVGSASAAAGKIDGGTSVTGAANQYITIPNNSTLHPTTAITLSAWINATNAQSGSGTVQPVGGLYYALDFDHANSLFRGTFAFRDSNNTWRSNGPVSISNGAWHSITGVYDGTNIITYLDGNVATSTNIGSLTMLTDTCRILIGSGVTSGCAAASPFVGSVDEVRLSYNYARSADWIKTEYNNESSPSTFLNIGAASGGGGTTTARRRPNTLITFNW